MPNILRLLPSLLVLSPALAAATTWGPTKVKDPINPRARCEVSEPMSFGSYIYQWPEKFDQVFWPLTETNGIWTCGKSGFVAFIGDFDGLSEAEVTRIRAFLDSDEGRAGDIRERQVQLDRLERLYALRDKDPHFRTVLLRVLAFHHENALDAPERAADYRRQALELIRTRLAEDELKPELRLEYLFVSSVYERWFGNTPASDAFAAQLEAALSAYGESEGAGYAEYLTELKAEITQIRPGGKLAPDAQAE